MNRSENFVVAWGAEWFFVAAGSSPRYAAKSRAFPIKGTLPFFSRPSVLLFFPTLFPLSKWLDTLFAGTCVFARQACWWCFFHREVNFDILLEFRIPYFFTSQQLFGNLWILCDIMAKTAWNEFMLSEMNYASLYIELIINQRYNYLSRYTLIFIKLLMLCDYKLKLIFTDN